MPVFHCSCYATRGSLKGLRGKGRGGRTTVFLPLYCLTVHIFRINTVVIIRTCIGSMFLRERCRRETEKRQMCTSLQAATKAPGTVLGMVYIHIFQKSGSNTTCFTNCKSQGESGEETLKHTCQPVRQICKRRRNGLRANIRASSPPFTWELSFALSVALVTHTSFLL